MNVRQSIPGLGEKMKETRTAAGLSQQQAGDVSGVHRISIAKFETGKTVPTLAVLYRLAAAYGVTVCDLLPPGVDEKDVPGEEPADTRPAKRK